MIRIIRLPVRIKQKKKREDKLLYETRYPDESSAYGFTLRYNAFGDTVSANIDTLFDRETFEDFSSYAKVTRTDFVAMLKRCTEDSGKESCSSGLNCTGINVSYSGGVISEVEVCGNPSSDSHGTQIVVKDLLKELEL